jgi:hypothetical protein
MNRMNFRSVFDKYLTKDEFDEIVHEVFVIYGNEISNERFLALITAKSFGRIKDLQDEISGLKKSIDLLNKEKIRRDD